MYYEKHIHIFTGFPGASVVKKKKKKQETQVLSLCWEDPLY